MSAPMNQNVSGSRLLQQLDLGLRAEQNDVDVREESRRHPKEDLVQKYQPRANGQLINRATGKIVPNHLLDDLVADTEIAYDRRFDQDDDALFSSEVAGYVNVPVETFQDRLGSEEHASLRRRQEKLLIEERRNRMVAFKDRATELEQLRIQRQDVERVRFRLRQIYSAVAPTAKRWYWLASVTGVMPGAPASSGGGDDDEEAMPPPPMDPTNGALPTLPYWLLTSHMYDQYATPDFFPRLCHMDAAYFQAINEDHAWAPAFLEQFRSRIGGLLSLVNEQQAFAGRVYLTLRDSVLAELLKFAGPTGTESAKQLTYHGLLLETTLLRSRVNEILSPGQLKTTAVTNDEVPPVFQNDGLYVTNRPSPGIDDQLLGLSNWQGFRDWLEAVLDEKEPGVKLRTFHTTEKDLWDTLFNGGVAKAFDKLFLTFPNGISPMSFAGLMDLLQATLMSPDITNPKDLDLFQTLYGKSGTSVFGQVTLTSPNLTGASPELMRRRAMQYALMGSSSGDTDFEVKRTDSPDGIAFSVVFSIDQREVLNVAMNKLSTQTMAAIAQVLSAFAILYDTPSLAGNAYETNMNRAVLGVLFWSMTLPLAHMQQTFLNGFEQAVRSPGTTPARANLRGNFGTSCAFAHKAYGPALNVLKTLRDDVNLAAEFSREVIRSTFVGRYDRRNIDPTLVIARTDESKDVFAGDVNYQLTDINVVRPANVPPPPPTLPPTPPIAVPSTNPIPAPPTPVLKLNDTVFFETWEKLYANLFNPNPNEYPKGAPSLFGWRSPPPDTYWRPICVSLVESLPPNPASHSLTKVWQAIVTATNGRYLTRRQRLTQGVPDLNSYLLKLTEKSEPENATAVEHEEAFQKSVNVTMHQTWKTTATSVMLDRQGFGSFKGLPLIDLLQALLIFTLYYYPEREQVLTAKLDSIAKTQRRMVAVLHASLTNDPTLALEELRQLAAETYIPDPRYHLQSKYTGRLKFTPQFITAVHAAYSGLQDLARQSHVPPVVNVWGKRQRVSAPPHSYEKLENVPLDVLTCNTDPAIDPEDPAAGPTRDYIDKRRTDETTRMLLRTRMAAVVAQHIFDIRLDAPDEYKSVIQHKRSPVQLAKARKGMTHFEFFNLGNRAWKVTLQ
jgi:hypothetical protein